MFTKFLTLNVLRVSLWIGLEWSFTSNYVSSPFKLFLRRYHRFYSWLSNFRIIYVIYKLKCLALPVEFLKIQEIRHVSNFRGKIDFFSLWNLRVPMGFQKNEPAVWLAIAKIKVLCEELYYIAIYQFELDLILG